MNDKLILAEDQQAFYEEQIQLQGSIKDEKTKK